MADDDLTRRQMLAAMLASAAPAAAADSGDDEQPDEDALPVPKEGPYVPLINQPPNTGYSPPRGPPPWADNSNMLASALAGGAVPSAMTGSAGLPPSPPIPSAPAGAHYAKLPGPPLLLPGGEAGVSESAGGGPSENPLAAAARALGIGGAQSAATPPVAAAGGTSQPIAGQASDLAPQTPEQQEIFRARQELRAQESALTAQINGTSNIELAKALAAQRLQLSTHDEHLRDLYISTLKTRGHVPNEAEAAQITAGGGDPSKYYFTGEGAPTLIPQEKEDKLEFRDIGPDQYGRPQYGSFNPRTGEVTPYKPPGAGVAPPAGAVEGEVETERAPSDQPVATLPPDQKTRIAQLDPAVQGHVQAILEGRETMPKIPAGGRVNPITQMITQGVFAVNPGFDAANNITQVATRKTYAPSGNNNAPGTLIQNGDAALDHLVQLKEASDKLANYGSVGGALVSGAAAVTGGRVGHDYSAARAELDTKAQIASAEAIKYLAGATGGGEMERDRLMHQFSSSNPPDSRLAAINGLAQDILEKKVELQAGWRRSMGPQTPDFEVISPNSIQSVNKLGLGAYLPRLGGSAARTAGQRRGVYVPGKGIQFQ